jgi:hypothetical protein
MTLVPAMEQYYVIPSKFCLGLDIVSKYLTLLFCCGKLAAISLSSVCIGNHFVSSSKGVHHSSSPLSSSNILSPCKFSSSKKQDV